MLAERITFEGRKLSLLYIKDVEEARKALYALLNSKAPILGLDIETAPKRDFKRHPRAGLLPSLSYIRLIQIYDSETDRIYIFDVGYLSKSNSFRQLLADLLYEKKFVAHNATFEISHFTHAGFEIPDIHCTLILANLIFHAEDDSEAETKAALKACVAREFGYDLPKEMQRSNWARKTLTKEQIIYAGIDAYIIVPLFKKYWPRLKKYNMKQVYALNKRAMYVVVEMQLNGIKIDRKKHLELSEKWERLKAKYEKKAQKILGDVNPNSSPQMTAWLQENLSPEELAAWPRTNSGKGLRKDSATFQEFSYLPFVAPLAKYNLYNKLSGTYGKNLYRQINPVTGRLHGGYQLARARTGRGSSSQPNMQNLTSKENFKSLFIAEEGHKFLIADYSQMEVRVMAELSQDPNMLKIYRAGKDIHAIMAAAIFNKKVEDLSADGSERKLGKIVILAMQYGMGPDKFRWTVKKQHGLDFTLDQCKYYIQVYNRLFAVLYQKKKEWAEEYKRTLVALTPLGKYRKLNPKRYYTQGINHPDQGGSAEIKLSALIRLQDSFREKKLPCKILLEVHDEIVCEVKEKYVDECRVIMKRDMETAARDIFPKICLKKMIDVKVVDNWLEAK